MARARRARARAERLLRAGLRAPPPRRCSAATSARCSSGRGRTRAGCSDSFRRGSRRGATASAAGPGRLDASLCAVRRAADRARGGRAGDRRLARPYRRHPDAAGAPAAAAASGDRSVCTALDAITRRAQMPAADFDRHRRALLAPSGDRSHYLEHALGASKHKELRRSASGWPTSARCCSASPRSPRRSPRRSTISSPSKRAAGRAAPAPRRPATTRSAASSARRSAAWRPKARRRSPHHGRRARDRRDGAAAERRAAWCWKIAYDESFARFSPGVLLTLASPRSCSTTRQSRTPIPAQRPITP